MDQCKQTIALVRSVGKALLERLSHFELNVQRKENNHQNLVTDFDIWVQEQLKVGLAEIEPKAIVFAEEQENEMVSGLTWFVDPIDGTTNFISTRRNFAICVALYDGMKPIFGVVYDVALDQCYHAVAGGPCYMNECALPKRASRALQDALLDTSLTTMNILSRRAGKPLHMISTAIRGHRAIGSAALAMCHIAEGTLDVYVSYRLYPWDYAASRVILEASGGCMHALYGEPLFTPDRAAVLCCGDEALYALIAPFLRGETDLDALIDK